MTYVETVIDVCEFCLSYHNRYAKDLPFGNAKKEAVQKCFCCKQSMCAKCLEHSRREVAGSVLATYWFEICRSCIATVRRANAMKPRLEKAVREAAAYVREQMDLNIYSLMQERTWAQSLKH